MKYTVSVRHSIETDVEVEADTPQEAVRKVDSHNFRLPPRDEWSGVKDWCYQVHDESGEVILEEENGPDRD